MFFEELESIAKKFNSILDEKNLQIISHNDADGICAASIFIKMLLIKKANFELRIVKQLTKDVIEKLKINGKALVLLDCGSGQIEELKNIVEKTNVLILDHHYPTNFTHPNLFHINPMLEGISDFSASMIAYLFIKALGVNNPELVDLAIVGGVGDLVKEEGDGKIIIEEAKELGRVKVERGIKLFGRYSRPIHKALEYSFDPFIPGISGSESNAVQFLSELGIKIRENENWRKLSDLSLEEQKKLASAIIIERLRGREEYAEDIFGNNYTLIKRPLEIKDSREFATLINACGKMDRWDIGIRVCLGDSEAIQTALAILDEYRKSIAQFLDLIFKEKEFIKISENATYIFAKDRIKDTLISPIVSILLSSNLVEKNKPIFGFVDSNEMIKISARASRELKINLNDILRLAANEVGGEGGGHCVSPDTLVQLSDGSIIKIEDLNPDSCCLRNVNLSTFNFEDEVPINFRKTKKKVIYHILAPPFEIECSGEHRLFTFMDNQIKEIRADKLKPGDFVLGIRKIDIKGKKILLPKPKIHTLVRITPNGKLQLEKAIQTKYDTISNFCKEVGIDKKNFYLFRNGKVAISIQWFRKILNHLNLKFDQFMKERNIKIEHVHNVKKIKIPKTITPEVAQIAGYTIGDGSSIYRKGIEFKDFSLHTLKKYNELFERSFKVGGRITKVKNKNCFRLRIFSVITYSILEQLGIFNGYIQLIPRCNSRVVSAFIAGVFDAEGSIGSHEIIISMKNKELLRIIQLLLLRFNIISNIENAKGICHLKISDFDSIKLFRQIIPIASPEKLEKLDILIERLSIKKRNPRYVLPLKYKDLKKYGISAGKHPDHYIRIDIFKERILPHLKNSSSTETLKLTKILADEKFLWCKIKHIRRKQRVIKMFDLTLPKNKNFVANGLIVHNSAAAGALIPKGKEEDFINIIERELKKYGNQKT